MGHWKENDVSSASNHHLDGTDCILVCLTTNSPIPLYIYTEVMRFTKSSEWDFSTPLGVLSFFSPPLKAEYEASRSGKVGCEFTGRDKSPHY